MDSIGRREEQILLAVGCLGDEAYLVSIRKFLSKIQGKAFSIGAIHIPLRRLEREGYISARLGEPTAARGGRRKKIYSLTAKAIKVLEESKRVYDFLWAKYADLKS
jgi:DNA-binding PadR family transcriptional regulator